MDREEGTWIVAKHVYTAAVRNIHDTSYDDESDRSPVNLYVYGDEFLFPLIVCLLFYEFHNV